MPPQISDDEASDVSAEYSPAPTKPEKQEVNSEKKGKASKVEEAESLMVESEKDGAEDDDDSVGPDEYVVEAITNHMVDEETGELRFEVKWEGYEKKSDRTWEPEDNLLETASKILNEYLASVGGKDQILSLWEEKKAEAAQKKGKKRGRASTNTPQNGANGAKRSKKTASETPPANAKQAEFKPPSGNWEDEVVHIDACEGNEGTVVVYLTWKGGQKSQHPLAQVYKRCPQKMLKFYESHLVFKKNDEA